MKLSIGNDHAGFDYKNFIIENLKNHNIINHGTDDKKSVDYPDFAHPVALDVENKKLPARQVTRNDFPAVGTFVA